MPINTIYKTYCSRCGKETIVSKVWEEKIGNSVVTTTKKVCPDKNCQKINDAEIKKMVARRTKMDNRHKNMIRNKKQVNKKGKGVNKHG